MDNIFTHKNIELPEGSYKISPSKINQFLSSPGNWYREEILHEVLFKGNTASVIGTICHYIYEQETKGEKVTREFITEQMKEYFTENPELIVDLALNVPEVQEVYPLVASAVMNQYVLLKNNEILVNGGKIETEIPMSLCLNEQSKIYLAGTCDRIENGEVLVDYKHVSKKPLDEVPFNYLVQLLAYAYMYNTTRNGNIHTIRLVYGVKPTKTLDARCFVVSKMITDNDMKMIKEILSLMVDTIVLSKRHPEYNYIIFKDFSLKEDYNG